MTAPEFESLVLANVGWMTFFAYQRLRSKPDAEDVVQDTIERLWRKVGKLDVVRGTAKFKTLLGKVTKDTVKNHLKLQQHRLERQGVFLERSPEPLSIEDRTKLQRALDMIPPEYAEAMIEVFGQGADLDVVARELGMTPDALRKKLYRFRKGARESQGT